MKPISSIIISVLCIFQINCATMLGSASLKEINENPHSFKDRHVRIKGVVTDSLNLPLKEGGLYRIFEENKYSIWVYTIDELPKRGEELSTTGTLKYDQSFTSFFTPFRSSIKSRV